MTTETYQQAILRGLQGLPSEALAEVTDFVYFLRKRLLRPEEFDEDMRALTLRGHLTALSEDEESHLGEEFEDYERLYPKE